MLAAEEQDQNGRDLDELFSRASSTWRSYKNSDETSKWTILNKLLFILRGDAPNVVFADHIEGDRDGTGKIVVFTDTYLVYGEGAMDEMSFKVIPKTNLEGLEVLTAARVTTEWGIEEPTCIVLSFKHGIQITLPPGQGSTPTAQSELHSLVLPLKNQLTKVAP